MTSLARDNPNAEVIGDYRRWLLKMATVYLPGKRSEWQDLAQEGAIAMWRALKTYDSAKGALPSWLTRAAKMRMQDCARRRTWTGTIGARGHIREQPPIPAPDEEIGRHQRHAEMAEGVEMAYHHGEIMRALGELPPGARKAIYERFWLDKTVSSSYWSAYLPHLAAELAHLRETPAVN